MCLTSHFVRFADTLWSLHEMIGKIYRTWKCAGQSVAFENKSITSMHILEENKGSKLFKYGHDFRVQSQFSMYGHPAYRYFS